MKNKERFRLEIKEISEAGEFEGLLSPYGNVDGGGDIVEKGAYTKTLKDQGPTRPMLWQHKADMPIGMLTLDDREDGLWCKGKLLMELKNAQDAYILIKARVVKGLSIGFESIKDTIDKNVRKLLEIKLYEGSIVTFPMNTAAMITSVKGKMSVKGDFNEELTSIQLSDAGYQMRWALSNALYSLMWSGLTREQILSGAETIIQQFNDAYLTYLPEYLDLMEEEYGSMESWSREKIETKQRAFEEKAGAEFSAANKKTLTAYCDSLKSVYDGLSGLIASDDAETKTDPAIPVVPIPVVDGEKAAPISPALIEAEAGAPGATTSGEKAAEQTEPVNDHSAAALVQIQRMKLLLVPPAA